MQRNTFTILALVTAVLLIGVSLAALRASHTSTAAAASDRQVAYEAYNEKDKDLREYKSEDGDLALRYKYLKAEWNSEIEDLGENVLMVLGLNRASLIAAGINTLKDVYDGWTLSDKLAQISSRRTEIGRKIAGLNLEVPPLKTAWESAKTHHEWHIAQDQGEAPGTGDSVGDCGHSYSSGDALQHKLYTGLCGQHSWFHCLKPSFPEREKHKRRVITTCSHTIYECQGLSKAEKDKHTYQSLPCGSHYGYACEADETHGKVITCPKENGKACLYGSYYACSEHSHSYPADTMGPCGHTYPPTSASSHSSRSFACSSHTYYACQTPSSSETQRHAYGTLPCGVHSGRGCAAASRHTQPRTCPTENGKKCDYETYYDCSPHTHSYPTSPSGNTTCSACNVSYDPNNTRQVNQHRVRPCRFAVCGNTWQTCQGSAPICNKPYRKRNGLRCYE
ncbi:hypothetical protein C6503_07965 [Candidatus Poribacteria bacterium]|nr:MAG: hypothetical protein C6503_07965 [Candidatus Poribacteria bacterium]